MYKEFVIIFSLLGVLIACMVAVLIMMIILLKKSSNDIPMSNFSGTNVMNNNMAQNVNATPIPNQSASVESVVFCKNCFTQFGQEIQFCPKCGTPRS